jgi:O-methyltransferase involved in polyketide biosynthesis
MTSTSMTNVVPADGVVDYPVRRCKNGAKGALRGHPSPVSRRISERWRAHSFDLDHARLRYFGERNEAAPYLTDLGWTLDPTSIRDLLAANDLPPIKDDDLRMGGVLYVSGALHKTAP